MDLDISASDTPKVKVFKTIVSEGPLSAYAVAKCTNIPQPTVHRIFKYLEEGGAIVLYQIDGPRDSRFYGITVLGIFQLELDLKLTQKQIHDIFSKWIKIDGPGVDPKGEKRASFKKEIERMYGDELFENEVRGKELFSSYLKYSARCLREYEKYIENEELPWIDKIAIGEKICAERYPEYTVKTITELYKEVPGFKEIINAMLNDHKEQIKFFESLEN